MMPKLSVLLQTLGLAFAIAMFIDRETSGESVPESQLLAGRYHQRSHAASALGRSNGVKSSRNTYQNHWDHVRPGTQPGRRAPEMIATKPEVGTRS
jgi:hypothetical protein